MGKYGYYGMKKVLVPGTNEDVHYVKLYNHLGSSLTDGKTLCGQQLHSINAVHVTKIDVTCEKCLELVDETKISPRSFDINPEALRTARNLIKRTEELALCLKAKVCPRCAKKLTITGTGLPCNDEGTVYTCSNCAFSLVRN